MSGKFQMRLTRFKHWLESQDPDTYVGTARQGNKCPIATWLVENGAFWPHVNLTTAKFRTEKLGDRIARPLPEWARRFVSSIDKTRSGCKTFYYDSVQVQAGQALAHLTKVEADLAQH